MFYRTNFLKAIKFSFLLLLISMCLSCEKESEELITYPDASLELVPYFYSFEKEAAKRSIKVDLRKAEIKGRLTIIHGSAVGVCNKQEVREILIDQKFWDTSSNLKKELIVFHELGHCFLNRVHNNQISPNGTCLSIMRNGHGCIDLYTEKTRSDLIDELFFE